MAAVSWKSQRQPDPGNQFAFRGWLEEQPREWSVAIAARAALRVLPRVHGTDNLSAIALPVFRATAIARFAANYPNRVVETETAANAANASITYAGNRFSSSAAYVAAEAAYAASGPAFAINASNAAAASAFYSEVRHDAERLRDRALTTERLARTSIWSALMPPDLSDAWRHLHNELHALGLHWQVWTSWYQNIALSEPHHLIAEAEDAAFTDFHGKLPWEDGAEAVNMVIALRLRTFQQPTKRVESKVTKKVRHKFTEGTLESLARVASPQPFIADDGRLDAGPNPAFDVPTLDDDLSTLPLRQCNLIKVILDDLPQNAPKHLKTSLRSYDEELRARGAQPILGLLKDDADIIAAAVASPSAEDEWLERGMRKAFTRFDENHVLFLEHFPRDAEREIIYTHTPLDEEQATGRRLLEPLELVAKAALEAHKVGAATSDFLAVTDKLIEFAHVVSTLPVAPTPPQRNSGLTGEIKVSPEDRSEPVTTKKRVVLGALGFFERTYNLVGSTVTIAGYAGIAEALKPAIETLSRLLR